jgi:prophage DNA circulation protein
MSKKIETNESYSYNNNNNNTNNNDFKESINRSLDEAKDNIKRSIDESKNQIPRYNNIVNSYQEQSLQTAREISEEYIDSQKEIISSLQSAWRPINENYSSMVTSFASPDSIAKAYTKFVSNVADNTVSAIRLANNIIFSNLDSMKSVMQQAKDNSRHLSNLSVNTAKTFEQNSRQLTSAAKDASANSQFSVSTPTSSTDYSTTTTKKQ